MEGRIICAFVFFSDNPFDKPIVECFHSHPLWSFAIRSPIGRRKKQQPELLRLSCAQEGSWDTLLRQLGSLTGKWHFFYYGQIEWCESEQKSNDPHTTNLKYTIGIPLPKFMIKNLEGLGIMRFRIQKMGRPLRYASVRWRERCEWHNSSRLRRDYTQKKINFALRLEYSIE